MKANGLTNTLSSVKRIAAFKLVWSYLPLRDILSLLCTDTALGGRMSARMWRVVCRRDFNVDPLETADLALVYWRKIQPLRVSLIDHRNSLGIFALKFEWCSQFFVVNAKTGQKYTTDEQLTFNTPFYLQSDSGHFLQRDKRVGVDRPGLKPHESCRFRIGLAPKPTQTWMVSYPEKSTGPVPWNSTIGLTIGGDNEDLYQPDNKMRRVLTSRHGDWIVVVQWWKGHEHCSFNKCTPPKVRPKTGVFAKR